MQTLGGNRPLQPRVTILGNNSTNLSFQNTQKSGWQSQFWKKQPGITLSQCWMLSLTEKNKNPVSGVQHLLPLHSFPKTLLANLGLQEQKLSPNTRQGFLIIKIEITNRQIKKSTSQERGTESCHFPICLRRHLKLQCQELFY